MWIFKDGGSGAGIIAESCLILCCPMDCSLSASSALGTSQAESWGGLPCLLQWIFLTLCTGRQILYHWGTREVFKDSDSAYSSLHFWCLTLCLANSRGSLSAGWLGLDPWHLVAQNQRSLYWQTGQKYVNSRSRTQGKLQNRQAFERKDDLGGN